MLVTVLEMITEDKPLQPQNAKLPIEMTVLGIVTEVSPLQYQKALFPMLVTA